MSARFRHLVLGALMRRPLATGLSLLAIALGVALGLAVQLIHSAALDEFGRGLRLLAGEADLQVVGGREGFDDGLYAVIAMHAAVGEASPVLEVDAALPGREERLRIFGIDALRVASVQAALLPMPVPEAQAQGAQRADPLQLLAQDTLFVSPAAAARLGVKPGDTIDVLAGTDTIGLRIAGGVPGAGVGQRIAVMDIAGAQTVFDRVGRLSRIDLRLREGADFASARAAIGALLPPGVDVLPPDQIVSQTTALSRAYRVNLTMLAVIALLTGSFLVFSTQLLAVVRRRQEFALLRALGMDRRTVARGILAEGAILGLCGGTLGIALGHALSGAAFALVGADLGAGYFQGVSPTLRFDPIGSMLFLALGVAAGVAGAWLPARALMRAPIVPGLAGEDAFAIFRVQPRLRLAVACAACAAAAASLPPIDGLPVGGYLAVALILAGSMALLSSVTQCVPGWLGKPGPVTALAVARLRAVPGQTAVAGAGVVASVALAVAMAIMVGSFRTSVDDWLARMLPAELYLRASSSLASGFLSADAVTRAASVPGVASVDAIRYDTLRLSSALAPLTLIARDVAALRLPLVAGVDAGPAGGSGDASAWLSEAAADLLGKGVGDALELPIGAQAAVFRVRGIWRDYARQNGTVMIDLADYRARVDDDRSNDLAITLDAAADPAEVAASLRDAFADQAIELADAAEIRALSLRIFDRTFLITYLMEAVAVLIGLVGIATSYAALATARRKEFGVLRHLGLTRGEVGRLLVVEGALTALVAVSVGIAAGGAMAAVLIEVVNRQSFRWSMDIDVPFVALVAFAVAVVVLAAIAARLAGAQATRRNAVLAVREDW